MAGRNLQDAMEKYKGQGGDRNEFFSLKNDKDTAVVRFLHEGEESLDWYIVHETKIEDKKRWVQCTEEGDCPFCKSGNKPTLKLFLQLVDKKDPEKIKTWERGQTFIPVILGLMNKYGDLCGRPYEIERHGKSGDMKTTYQLYPMDRDDKVLKDLPEKQNLLGDKVPASEGGDGRVRQGGFIIVASIQDMRKMVEGTYTYPRVAGTGREESRRDDRPRDEERRREDPPREDRRDDRREDPPEDRKREKRQTSVF